MLLTVVIFSICEILDFSCASKGFPSADREDHAALPPLNHIDDYEKCQKYGKPFCSVIIKLVPGEHNSSSSIWKYIEKTKDKKRFVFRRDELQHAICVEGIPHGQSSRMESIQSAIIESYHKRLDHLGLIPILSEVDCVDDNIKINTYDWIVLFGILSYITLVAWATFQGFCGSYKSEIQPPKRNSYMQCFCIKNGWNKLISSDKNISSESLKSFQGLRFYTTCLIIVGHTYVSFGSDFKANPEYFEDTSNTMQNLIALQLPYAVQAFFLMSSWLMSYQFLQTLANENSKKMRYVILSILNRYLRLLPLLAILIAILMTTWIKILRDKPLNRLVFLKQQEKCFKNWWTNLLFIQNIYDRENMCFPHSWYIAVDFQLYVLSMLLLFSAWILKQHFKSVIFLLLLFGVIVQSTITYVYSTDFLIRLSPKSLKIESLVLNESKMVYSSTYSNIATYAIGLGFGYIYYHRHKYTIFLNSAFFRVFSTISFLALPAIVLVLSCYQYNQPITCLLSGITKPLFGFGLGVGILGISCNVIFCIPKKIFDSNLAVILGKITFSTYLVHVLCAFGNLGMAAKPTFLSDQVLFTAYLRNVLGSFFLGFLVFLFVEQPMMQLQNLVIPQARNERCKYSNDVNTSNVKNK